MFIKGVIEGIKDYQMAMHGIYIKAYNRAKIKFRFEIQIFRKCLHCLTHFRLTTVKYYTELPL